MTAISRTMQKKAKAAATELPSVSKRAILSVTITYGLFNVDAQVTGMDVDTAIHMNTLERSTGKPVRRKFVGAKDNILSEEEMMKAFKLSDGTYVPLEKDEIDAVKPKSTKVLEIQKFVDILSVDPTFYDTSYTLTPGPSAMPYAVLARALAELGKAALVRVCIRSNEHPALVRAYHGALVLTTLRRRDEVIDPSQVPSLRELPEPPEKMVEMALNIFDDKTLEGEYDPGEYKDRYKEELMLMVEDKRAGRKIAMKKPEEKPKTDDIMAALTAMSAKKGKGKKA
jgi:DNA end-binding protein Ku